MLIGIIMLNETSEYFLLTWFKIGGYWVLDEFTKTQPFSMEEVKPNVDFHIFICNFLQFMEFMYKCKDLPNELKEFKGLLKMRVMDAGEYFETEDVNRLVRNFDRNFQLIEAIAEALKEMGWKVTTGGKNQKKPLMRGVGIISNELSGG